MQSLSEIRDFYIDSSSARYLLIVMKKKIEEKRKKFMSSFNETMEEFGYFVSPYDSVLKFCFTSSTICHKI